MKQECTYLLKYILCSLCLTAIVVFADEGYDASLPEDHHPGYGGIRTIEIRSMTPPLVGSFAAPDGAMRGLAFDGQYLWAANSGDGNSMYGSKIYRLDPDSGTVINAYNGIVNHPCGLAWDGQYLWHSAYIGGMIFQLDTLGLTVVKSFAAPTMHPFDLAWYGGNLYAVRGNEQYISVIDTSDGSEIDSIHATYTSPNVRPFGLTFIIRNAPQLLTCDGNYGSNLVNMWNLYANNWVDQWAGEPTIYPSGLAYDSASERLWMSCYEHDSIYIYDMSQVGITESEIEHADGIRLDACPNPFTNSTDIRYQITDDRHECEIKVYDIAGRQVADLSEQVSVIGHQSSVQWDGTDDTGCRLPAGVYFLKTSIMSTPLKLLMVNK